MALKAIVNIEEFNGLSDEVQSHYGQDKNGSHTLDVTTVNGLELTPALELKGALAKEKNNLKDALAKLKLFDGIKEPDKALDALAKVKEMADWNPDEKTKEARKEMESQLQDKVAAEQKQFLTKHGEELKRATTENTSLVAQLQEVLIGQQATKAISDANGAVDLLIHPVRAQTRMVKQDDGKYQVEVLDPEGNARISPNAGSMEKMSIPDLVNEFKSDDRFARAFDGSSAQGSGSGEGVEGSGSSRNVVLSAVDAKDPVKYRRAKALAEKRGVKLELRE